MSSTTPPSFSTKHLSFGLNKRTNQKTNERKAENVLMGDNESSEEEEQDDVISMRGGRKVVNRAIQKEQEFIRQRAIRAANEYDYDELCNSEGVKKEEEEESRKEKKGSRYIEKLLKTAKVRKMENEIAYERKLAREQKEEEENDEYHYGNKEKFLTKAYKKKLEEREAYKREQAELEMKEEANDVTKRGIGAMTTGFYANLNKNVAMGNRSMSNEIEFEDHAQTNSIEDTSSTAHDKDTSHLSEVLLHPSSPSMEPQISTKEDEEEKVRSQILARAALRASRAEKVAAARERYLIRHQITST